MTVRAKLAALQELLDLGEAGGFSREDREFIQAMTWRQRRGDRFSDRMEYRIERTYKEQFGEGEMRCRWCEGMLLPEEYYDSTICRAVRLLKCKSCGRPFASQMQFVSAAAPLPEEIVEGVLERNKKRKQKQEEVEVMAEKKLCKVEGCGKLGVKRGGFCTRHFKATNSGGMSMKPPEKGPQEGAAAPDKDKIERHRIPGRVRPTKEEVEEERGHWKPLPPVLSGSITFNISGWSLEKLLKLKELVEG